MRSKARPNLKAQKHIFVLIWGLYIGFGILVILKYLEQGYHPMWVTLWTISSLIAFIPYLYWAYLPLRFTKEYIGSSKSSKWFKISKAVIIISFISFVFSIASPDAVYIWNLAAIEKISGFWYFAPLVAYVTGFLFFVSMYICLVLGAGFLVKSEKGLLNITSNRPLTHLAFLFLPIGIFSLAKRMQNLYDSSPQGVD